ncbi:transposase [Acidovorax sp. PRC11]|uniref:IS256 family transposase n=1 Tax=Acidovorax sp. PRC11 TaxID=2962592 RepID=UPI00288145F5|nr:transposase [Acidovorax sp. PRC11]MDT0138253.1 transposase [Acidovorax sp. PRC11]
MNTKKHDVPEELLSGLLANYKKPEDLIGENGLLKQLTKLLVERALDAELTEHLGHERNEAVAKGFPDAIEAVFPKAVVQLCIVHMVRHSLNYVSWKRRKEVAADLRRIYTATTAEEAELMLGEFEARWDAEYLPIGQSWRRNWSRLTPFFDYPPEIRKVIYTTNAIESVNMSLRKLTKNRGSFPSDEALTKLFYLALRNISQKWTMPIRDWKAALTRFTIQFGDRISVN